MLVLFILEGRILQGRIGKLRTSDPPEKSKVFAKLVLEAQAWHLKHKHFFDKSTQRCAS